MQLVSWQIDKKHLWDNIRFWQIEKLLYNPSKKNHINVESSINWYAMKNVTSSKSLSLNKSPLVYCFNASDADGETSKNNFWNEIRFVV